MTLTDLLIGWAQKARENAYVPYSNYAVGAAVMGKNGQIYTGCNVENAVYPVTICAERNAIFKAVSEGCREFDIIAIVTRDGGSPCGSCRQVMAEFSPDMRVITANEYGTITADTTVRELLPNAFSPKNLEEYL